MKKPSRNLGGTNLALPARDRGVYSIRFNSIRSSSTERPLRAGHLKFSRLRLHWVSLTVLALSFISRFDALAQSTEGTGATPAQKSDQPTGIDLRVPWTTSRLVGSPDPPAPYQAVRVFSKLGFKSPVDLSSAPGTARLFLAEQGGQVYSFDPEAAAAQPDLVLALNNVVPGLNALYGITFHPGFATNHLVYLCYVLKDGLADGSHVSRFEMKPGEPPLIDPASEKIILTFPSGGHNGGCLKFGPDGFLYISTGDAGNPTPPDPLATGQDISDLLSSILRIDVNHTGGNTLYQVPADNPFVGRAGARPEVWAYGLRNPWRMSFDQGSGALWVADVGWELWEMVYQVERGGNYGWSIMEGPQSIRPNGRRGPTPILPPIKAHPHSEAASITGGFVYRGKRLPELFGAYIYGDWVTGKIWALRRQTGESSSVMELVDTPLQIVCFGEDNTQELFIVDYGGGIYQLTPQSALATHQSFPRKLSETGLFASTPNHALAAGVLPFEVNAATWVDHAIADRFVALPNRSQIQTGAKDVWLYQSKNEWRYPTNAVLGRTLSLEMETGNPATLQRLETQLLHYDGLDWHAYTYRWNSRQDDAELVDAVGDETVLEVKDATAPSGHRQQSWRFPSRSECLRCHNPWVNVALAFTAPQLNRSLAYRGGYPLCGSSASRGEAPSANSPKRTANQLRTLSSIGYFDQPLDERSTPKFTDPYDTRADLNERARSWLNVNCGHCHREGAGGSVPTHFDYETRRDEMKAIGQLPTQGTFGLDNSHILTAGAPENSVLYYRIATTGQGRMPLIGSRQVDAGGLQLLSDWIKSLTGDAGTAHPTPSPARSKEEIGFSSLWDPTANSSQVDAALDQLLANPSGALGLLKEINGNPALHPCPPQLLRKAAAHPAFQVRDLFERFLPEELLPKKLGLNPKSETILSLRGDPIAGERIFFREGTQCAQCHRVRGQGRDFGPDLSQIARKYPRPQLLDQILFPSKSIDAQFVSYQIESKQDLAYTGFILKRSPIDILLKDVNLSVIRITADEIKSIQPQQLSAMPEGLLQSMTAQEAADLLEFLTKLE